MNTEPNNLQNPDLSVDTSEPSLERWREIQAGFVDDPQRSVADARQLIDELTQQVVDALVEKRSALDRQWSTDTETSTEQLRVCLQQYRAFFAGLIPVMPAVSPRGLQRERDSE